MADRLTNREKETIIIFDEDEKLARIETFNGRLIRRLTELSGSREDCRKVSGPDEYGAYKFEFPAKWLKVNPGLMLTEEQRAKKSEQMKRQWENQFSQSETSK